MLFQRFLPGCNCGGSGRLRVGGCGRPRPRAEHVGTCCRNGGWLAARVPRFRQWTAGKRCAGLTGRWGGRGRGCFRRSFGGRGCCCIRRPRSHRSSRRLDYQFGGRLVPTFHDADHLDGRLSRLDARLHQWRPQVDLCMEPRRRAGCLRRRRWYARRAPLLVRQSSLRRPH